MDHADGAEAGTGWRVLVREVLVVVLGYLWWCRGTGCGAEVLLKQVLLRRTGCYYAGTGGRYWCGRVRVLGTRSVLSCAGTLPVWKSQKY